MTPLTLVSWALAISLSCATLAVALPIDRWVSEYLTRRLARFRELEDRVAALERKTNENATADSQVQQSD